MKITWRTTPKRVADGLEVGPDDDLVKAVRDVQALGGGTVYLRPGRYRYRELAMPEGVEIRAKRGKLS